MTTLSESTPETGTEQHENIRAREVAGLGDYQEILNILQQEGLLRPEMDRVSKQYEAALSGFPNLTEADLEMLTVLDLYDPITASHTVATYRIAHEKIGKRLHSGVQFEELFEREGVSTETFLRAALHHDIGKVTVPRFVMHHPMNDHQMNVVLHDLAITQHQEALLERLAAAGVPVIGNESEEEFEHTLAERRLRSVHFVPIEEIITEDELADLSARGFESNMTLIDVLRTHEEHSERILESVGHTQVAELAGQHHNYREKPVRYPITVGALQLSVDASELLHLADVKQALIAERPYKESLPYTKVLRILLNESKGKISEAAAYLWLEDDIATLRESSDELTPEDIATVESIEHELEAMLSRLLSDPEVLEELRLAA